MNKFRYLTLSLACAPLIVACDGDNNNSSTGPTGEIRVIHASKDAPQVDVVLTELAGNTSSTAVDDLDYSDSSGYASVAALTYDVSVQAVLPDGSNPEVIAIPGVGVAEDSRTTVVAVGTVAVEAGTDIPLEAITVADPAVDPAADEVSVAVVHASPTAGAVRVVVQYTGGSADFDFDYQDVVDASSVVAPLPAGTVTITVAPSSAPTDILYNSGPVDLTSYAGQKLLILAVDTTTQIRSDATNGSPIKLLVAADAAANNAVLLDSSTQAGVKVAHVSPDAGPVDVTVNGSIPGAELTGLDYLEVSLPGPSGGQAPANQAYIGLDAGTYTLNVQPTGSGTDVLNPSPSVPLTAGEEYSVLALGRVGDAGATAFTLIPTVDSNRSIATQASLKVAHGAPDVGTVDVYAVAGGSDILLFDDVSFGEVTDYLPISVPLTATVEVRDQGGAALISVSGVTLSAGDVVTAIAYQADQFAPIDPTTAGLLLLTN